MRFRILTVFVALLLATTPAWTEELKGKTEKEAPPSISSIVTNDQGRWKLLVTNREEDSYSVSFEVDHLDRAGKKIRTEYPSFSIQPGKTVERKLSGSPTVERFNVKLASSKKLSSRSKSRS